MEGRVSGAQEFTWIYAGIEDGLTEESDSDGTWILVGLS